MSIRIRPEHSADFPAIHDLVRLAFEKAEHSDGDEHFLVNRLRQSHEYIPELTFVAEENGCIVGHIMFTTLKVGEGRALALAPLSVLPGHQSKGIGAALIRHGHDVARTLGHDLVILLGHPGYYPRFGYKLASSFGITAPFDVPNEAFMALSLRGTSTSLPGVVEYSPAFFPEKAE